ncbi:hypothetical protein [Actinomycetospora sp. TBRC 11914]|uniref:hypothetical protein n=1 Tax=Actinomycetospora sp. TBRC 11914 TaxID=2729387 RepID=UPI00145DFD9B|nr:hypothetical protein [Actinomycetospora sp. TBRC 11914]NMO90987.1 hypothetical protein [Actinomycetospora sp. TBRC 11914]
MTHSTQTGGTTNRASRSAGAGPATLRAVQVLAVLSVLNLVCQYVTAGQLLPRGGHTALGLHATGAIVMHVLTGLLTVAAALYARTHRGPWWPAVVAAVVFVLSFVQAYAGDHGILSVHVPGALLVTVGIVWVTAWSFSRGVRP